MYPNLDVEQARCGHSDEYVARRLGITERAYRDRKESNAMRLPEAVALTEMYDKSMEYLFWGQGRRVNVKCYRYDGKEGDKRKTVVDLD
jgi:hypothetical protein